MKNQNKQLENKEKKESNKNKDKINKRIKNQIQSKNRLSKSRLQIKIFYILKLIKKLNNSSQLLGLHFNKLINKNKLRQFPKLLTIFVIIKKILNKLINNLKEGLKSLILKPINRNNRSIIIKNSIFLIKKVVKFLRIIIYKKLAERFNSKVQINNF